MEHSLLYTELLAADLIQGDEEYLNCHYLDLLLVEDCKIQDKASIFNQMELIRCFHDVFFQLLWSFF